MREVVDVVYVPRVGGVVTGVQKGQTNPASGLLVGLDYGYVTDHTRAGYASKGLRTEYSLLFYDHHRSENLLVSYKYTDVNMLFGYNYLLGGRAIVNHGKDNLFSVAADVSIGGSLGYEILNVNVHAFAGPSWSRGEAGLLWGAQVVLSLGLPIMPDVHTVPPKD